MPIIGIGVDIWEGVSGAGGDTPSNILLDAQNVAILDAQNDNLESAN